MNDTTFLRNLASRGKVALLADGAAVPLPVSVMDDETRAGAPFRINLVSPEEIESGDRRTFAQGTVDHRDLPLPLMWQWQLDEGHKTAVVVGRIDHIEETPDGLGNARGVFDTGPWGREAERMVRDQMLRGVSGDYSNFDAQVLEKVKEDDDRLLDDKVRVQKSKLVAATIVAKPAFEGCYIEIDEGAPDETAAEPADPDEHSYEDGIIEASVPITASAVVAGGRIDLVLRLEKLEAYLASLESEELAVTASAARSRILDYRLQRERELAVARMRAARNITAAWKPLSSSFLSAKAKAQPRDMKGRWIEMGGIVRWDVSTQHVGGVPQGGTQKYKQGQVKSYNSDTKMYRVQPLDGTPETSLLGKNIEVVKAAIPDTPDEARNIALGQPNKEDNSNGDDASGASPEGASSADGPATSEGSGDLGQASTSEPVDDEQVGVTIDKLVELLGESITDPDPGPDDEVPPPARDRPAPSAEFEPEPDAEPDDPPFVDDARTRGKLTGEWPPDTELSRVMFDNVGQPGETWDDPRVQQRYERAAALFKKTANSPFFPKRWRERLYEIYGEREKPDASRPTPVRPPTDDDSAPVTAPAPDPDVVKKMAGGTVDALQSLNKGTPEDSVESFFVDDTDTEVEDEALAGDYTEMAKAMFENLNPYASWDEADQDAWIKAAEKALESRDD